MTAPDAPDTNDDVIRVVYQAVADYTDLIRANRRAREETRALKRDIDTLAGSTTHHVKVTADTGQARAELARVLRDVIVQIKVTVDAAAARTELTRLLRDVTVKARVVVDAATANTDIARMLRDVIIRARIVVDAATARAEIARTVRDTQIRVRVSADTAALAALSAALARIRDLAVTVAVRADTAAVDRLRTTLAGLRDLAVTVRVDVDDTRARARIEALLAAGEGIQLHVALDDHGITERFAALVARLQAIARVNLRVELDDSAFRRFTVLLGQLVRLRSQLNAGGAPIPTPAPRPPTPAAGGRTVLQQAKDAVPSWLSSAAGMILKFLPLISAAVPVTAALAGGIGAVGAAFLAAGAGAGIFAVAAIGAVARLTAAVQAYEKTGTLASGPMREAVEQFEALKDRYRDLENATDRDVFAVFSKGLRIAYDLLGKVQGVIAPVAAAIGGALDQVDAAINGAGFDDFLSFVADRAPRAIAQLTAGLLGFGGGLGRLLMQFAPFATTFVDGFARIGREFDQWAAGLDSNTGFQQFMAYAEAEVPRVIDLVVALVHAGANLVTALAPMGDMFLSAATGAAHLIAALPPGVLAAILGALLGAAAGVKALQLAITVTEGIQKFGKFLTELPGWAGRAATSLGVVRSAMLAIGAATLIGAALTGITLLIGHLATANQDAADKARDHADAVGTLASALRASRGEVDHSVRAQIYDQLDTTNVTGTSGAATTTGSVTDVAKGAGVNLSDLTSGAGGDEGARARVDKQFQDYIAQRRRQAHEAEVATGVGGGPGAASQQLTADAEAAQKAYDAWKAQGGALDEAVASNKDRAAAVGAATDATDKDTAATGANTDAVKSAVDAADQAAGAYRTQAGAHDALVKALSVNFAGGEVVTKYAAATTALQAYDDAVQAHIDASNALDDANFASVRAEQAVIKAREDAVQRVKDLQRTLRDSAIDERQAALNVRQSDKNLQRTINSGATPEEIEQARLDNERAHNALNDLRQDRAPKNAATRRDLAKGVEGQDALVDARRNADATARQLETARINLGKSSEKLSELHLAFQTAAGALGLSEDAVRKLKTRVDTLRGKTVDVTVKLHGDDALRKILQGQYAMQLMAEHPDWKTDRILAEAATYLPTVGPAAPANPTALDNIPNNHGGRYAGGGPALVSATTAGPVYGPGTGTSDSVQVVLPVGGPARLSRGEHIVTDSEVQHAPGGHAYLEAFRAGLRAGRPWRPAAPPPFAAGGAAWPAGMPALKVPAVTVAVPGYAGGGPAGAAVRGIADVIHQRSVTVNVGTITNAVPETAGASLYRQVRRAVDGEES